MTSNSSRKLSARVDVVVASRRWIAVLPSVVRFCRKIAQSTVAEGLKSRKNRAAKRAPTVELSVILTSDAAVKRLNAAWRGQDKPTNVLSFPASDGGDAVAGAPFLLGDVVIAYATVSRESVHENKTLRAHLAHMVVHGVLHLLGYDHLRAGEARAMAKLEVKILSRLGISDPYAPPARRKARR